MIVDSVFYTPKKKKGKLQTWGCNLHSVDKKLIKYLDGNLKRRCHFGDID
jgi:hypothetical protein